MNKKINKYLIFSIVGILIFLFIFFLYKNIINENEKLKNENLIIKQNVIALQDSLNMSAKKNQEYAIFIKNLSNENLKLKNKEIIFKNNYKLLLDSLKILNKIASTNILDTNIILINFEGNQGKIYYKGNVTYFLVDKKALHSIEIIINPIKIENIIFYDSKNNIIKSNIFADGVLIDNAYTIIDSSIYSKILNSNIIKIPEEKYNNNIFLLFEYNYFSNFNPNNNLNLGIGYKYKSFIFEIKNDFINKNLNFSTKYLFKVLNF